MPCTVKLKEGSDEVYIHELLPVQKYKKDTFLKKIGFKLAFYLSAFPTKTYSTVNGDYNFDYLSELETDNNNFLRIRVIQRHIKEFNFRSEKIAGDHRAYLSLSKRPANGGPFVISS